MPRVRGRGTAGRRAGRGAIHLAVAVVALLASSCARAPVSPHPDREPFADAPPQTASADELRSGIATGRGTVTSLRGKLEVALRETADARYRSCHGVLAARNPWTGGASPGIYLHGYRGPMPSLFTFVSDGRTFWLHVPRDQIVYTGPVDAHGRAGGARGEWLEARDLFRALFVEPVDPADEVEIEEEPGSYVLSVLHLGRPVRRIWVDRRGLVARRETFLDAAGRPELVLDRERYRAFGDRLYPARIVVTDARTGRAVRLDFTSVVVDPPDLDATAFRAPAAPGARVERIAGEGDRT